MCDNVADVSLLACKFVSTWPGRREKKRRSEYCLQLRQYCVCELLFLNLQVEWKIFSKSSYLLTRQMSTVFFLLLYSSFRMPFSTLLFHLFFFFLFFVFSFLSFLAFCWLFLWHLLLYWGVFDIRSLYSYGTFTILIFSKTSKHQCICLNSFERRGIFGGTNHS